MKDNKNKEEKKDNKDNKDNSEEKEENKDNGKIYEEIKLEIKKNEKEVGKKVSFLIWDDLGKKEEENEELMNNKIADVYLLVYDITNKKSFDELNNWIKKIKEINDIKKNDKKEISKMVIIGNISDSNKKREVTEEDGKKIAKGNDALFFEIKNINNIMKIFIKIGEDYFKKKEN